jgi:NAD(P)-dependent dehydrogenase (short-subunit alcohol dehydrogenase family)
VARWRSDQCEVSLLNGVNHEHGAESSDSNGSISGNRCGYPSFRDRNYHVVATSRSIKPVADSDVVTVQGDIGAADTAERVFKTAFERFGRVDTLVNNAGMFMAKPFTAYSRDDYATYMATNVTGFFHMTQRALEFMGKQGRGHVLTITTSLVDQPMSAVPAVLASLTKGALSAATRALAIEYAKTGVRINAVSPGIIKTPMHPPEAHQALAASIQWVGWEMYPTL